LQDFLAAELRELKAPLDAVEKQLDRLEGKVDSGFARLDSKMDRLDAKKLIAASIVWRICSISSSGPRRSRHDCAENSRSSPRFALDRLNYKM
jgi:hypothetical protein